MRTLPCPTHSLAIDARWLCPLCTAVCVPPRLRLYIYVTGTRSMLFSLHVSRVNYSHNEPYLVPTLYKNQPANSKLLVGPSAPVPVPVPVTTHLHAARRHSSEVRPGRRAAGPPDPVKSKDPTRSVPVRRAHGSAHTPVDKADTAKALCGK